MFCHWTRTRHPGKLYLFPNRRRTQFERLAVSTRAMGKFRTGQMWSMRSEIELKRNNQACEWWDSNGGHTTMPSAFVQSHWINGAGWLMKMAGANQNADFTLALYAGISLSITAIADAPCEWPIKCNCDFSVFFSMKSMIDGKSWTPDSWNENCQNSFSSGSWFSWLRDHVLPRVFPSHTS